MTRLESSLSVVETFRRCYSTFSGTSLDARRLMICGLQRIFEQKEHTKSQTFIITSTASPATEQSRGEPLKAVALQIWPVYGGTPKILLQ